MPDQSLIGKEIPRRLPMPRKEAACFCLPDGSTDVQRLRISPVQDAPSDERGIMIAAGLYRHGPDQSRGQDDCGPIGEGSFHGVYQIGDVNARPCVVIGTSSPIFTSKRLAS